jgi:hypothetical protein
MAKTDLLKLTRLVNKAARDKAFRDKLILTPTATTAGRAGIALDKKTAAQLKKVSAGLKRFGGNPKLNPQDAKNWTIGLLHHTKFFACFPDEE